MRYAILLAVFISGCVSRSEVEADIWLVKKIPNDKCPAGTNHGFYRKIICKKPAQHTLCAGGEPYYIERVSFCSDRAENMVSMKKEDAIKWLEELTRPDRN